MNYRFSAFAVTAIVCLAGISGAWAESIERSGNDRINTVKPRGIQAFTGSKPTGINEIPAKQTVQSVGGRTMNIAQPSVPAGVQPSRTQQRVQQPAPQQVQAAEPTRSPTKKTATRKRTKKSPGVSEAQWWRDSGNPKVFAFRDCISAYARSQANKTLKLNLQSVVSRSIKRECDKSFSSMSEILAGRFGTEKSRKIAQELTESTFVPAVREAVLAVRKQQKQAAAAKQRQPEPAGQPANKLAAAPLPVPAQPVPISKEAELELAKQEMFSCYREAADRVAPQRNRPVDAIVDNVLLECSGNTRAFFKRLFAIYPHSPSGQADRMRAAISDNYRPAIAKRVTAIRATGVSVQKQKVTSTEQ